MRIRGQECTVGILLEELYKKATSCHLWGLVRHTAGMLHKRVEDLGPVSGREEGREGENEREGRGGKGRRKRGSEGGIPF